MASISLGDRSLTGAALRRQHAALHFCGAPFAAHSQHGERHRASSGTMHDECEKSSRGHDVVLVRRTKSCMRHRACRAADKQHPPDCSAVETSAPQRHPVYATGELRSGLTTQKNNPRREPSALITINPRIVDQLSHSRFKFIHDAFTSDRFEWNMSARRFVCRATKRSVKCNVGADFTKHF